MEILRFKLQGTQSLMMHNPISMAKPKPTGMKGRDVPSPEEEALVSRYVLPDGNFYVPAVGVRKSMLEGSIGFTIGKRAAYGVLAGAVTLIDEAFPLLNGDGTPYSGNIYIIDTRRVRVGQAGIMRSRALISLPWTVDCAFRLNQKLATMEQVKDALNNAGLTKGLLDYRPGKGGWFGTYEVADMSVDVV